MIVISPRLFHCAAECPEALTKVIEDFETGSAGRQDRGRIRMARAQALAPKGPDGEISKQKCNLQSSMIIINMTGIAIMIVRRLITL